jgi:sarcosine oxidase subunit alpha
LYAGAHFLEVGAAASLENDQGYLTSVAYSPMLGHWIGLGFLKRGPERHGARLRAFCAIRGSDAEVEVVSPLFFDPEGGRLNV